MTLKMSEPRYYLLSGVSSLMGIKDIKNAQKNKGPQLHFPSTLLCYEENIKVKSSYSLSTKPSFKILRYISVFYC